MINERTAWEAFYRAIEVMNRRQIWAPLFSYLLLKLVLIFLYAGTSAGAGAAVWKLAVGHAGDHMAHYPYNYYLLPVVLGRLDLVMEVFVSVIFQGAVIVLFMQAFSKSPASLGKAFRATRERYVPIVIVSFLAAAALYLWFGLQHIVEGALLSKLPYLLVSGPFVIGGLCVQALFIFTMPLVLLDGASPLAAVRDSFRAAFDDPARAFLIVSVPFTLTLPALYVADKGAYLVQRLSPEILMHVQIFYEVVHWPAMVFLLGGLAALFVRRKQSYD